MEKSSIGHDEGSKEQKAPTTTQPDVSIPHAPDEEDDPGLDDLDGKKSYYTNSSLTADGQW